jgi:hypothetical protein
VTPEVSVDALVCVQSQELSYYLGSKDLRIGELESGSASSAASDVLESVAYEAEDGDDEGVKIDESRDLLLAFGRFGRHRA